MPSLWQVPITNDGPRIISIEMVVVDIPTCILGTRKKICLSASVYFLGPDKSRVNSGVPQAFPAVANGSRVAKVFSIEIDIVTDILVSLEKVRLSSLVIFHLWPHNRGIDTFKIHELPPELRFQ